MKDRKHTRGMLKLGIPSMIVIFTGLNFALMAALAVSIAKSDYQLSLDLAKHTSEYYGAVNKAEQKMSDIESLYEDRDVNNQKRIAIKMNEEQTLTILLQFQPNSMKHTILEYQVVNEQEWEGDTSLPELLTPQF